MNDLDPTKKHHEKSDSWVIFISGYVKIPDRPRRAMHWREKKAAPLIDPPPPASVRPPPRPVHLPGSRVQSPSQTRARRHRVSGRPMTDPHDEPEVLLEIRSLACGFAAYTAVRGRKPWASSPPPVRKRHCRRRRESLACRWRVEMRLNCL